MATTTVTHTYKLKRGKQSDVERVNPILAEGEPVVVYCEDGKTRMKIGDGIKEYKELNFIGEGESGELEIINRDYKEDFPNIGDVNKIYKAEKEQKLYQWNPTLNEYEPLDKVDVDIDIGDIEIISGGDAADLLRV